MKLSESKIKDIAIEAGEHLGLYDEESQTFSRKEIVQHLMKHHGLKQKRDIAFVIDVMQTSFPDMKIQEGSSTVRLSDIIVMVKDAMKKKPRVKNYNKLKDLLPQLENYLADRGDIEIPQKDFIKIMSMSEGQTLDGGKGDHTSPKDVDQNELKVGIEVEYEHAKGDRIAAIDVALDHLKENPKYYSELVKSGIVDEPNAIKLAKELLDVEPVKEERYYQGKLKKVEHRVVSETKIRNVIREELKGLLKEEPELWKYIYNFGNTYKPKRQGK